MSFYRRFAVRMSAVLCLLCAPTLVFASTAANTIITNEVTVTWQNASGSRTSTESASVSLTVNLVASVPHIELAQDPIIKHATEDTVLQLHYRITATANGPDTYHIVLNNQEVVNLAPEANMENSSEQTIRLGATTLAADANTGDDAIFVPYDAANHNADNLSINGITEGTTLLIGTNVYTVGAIDRGASHNAATNTARIPLTTPIENGPVAAGTIVGEQRDISLSVRTGFITPGNTTGHYILMLKLNSQSDPNVEGTGGEQSTITIHVSKPLLSISKFARNISNTAFNPGASAYTLGGTDYYSNDISGNPDDRIEYLIVIDNTHEDSGLATNIIVKDTIPPFTNLVENSIYLAASEATNTTPPNFIGPLTEQADNDAGRVVDRRIYVYAGTGGTDNDTDPETEGGGELEQGRLSFVRFQLIIQ